MASATASSLQRQQDLYDNAYQIISAGVTCEESGDVVSAAGYYRDGIGILEKGVKLEFRPEDRQRAEPLHKKMLTHLNLILDRLDVIEKREPVVVDRAGPVDEASSSPGFFSRIASAFKSSDRKGDDDGAFPAIQSNGIKPADRGKGPAAIQRPQPQGGSTQPTSAQPTNAPLASTSSHVPGPAVVRTAGHRQPKQGPPPQRTPVPQKGPGQFNQLPPSQRGSAAVARPSQGAQRPPAQRAAPSHARNGAQGGPPPPIKGVDPKLQSIILDDVLDNKPGVGWDSIAGLLHVKQALQEMVILPAMRPELFTGLRTPPRGLLLFGPPGNGKTLLAKAVAQEAQSTFFSMSASSLTSKYVGEGEKLMRALFAVARYVQPSIIFIDEIDSILGERKSDEHEASRRLKTEFLVQFDGVTSSSEDRLVVLGATNRPYEIDEAARRRFTKRLYVPLPDPVARRALLLILLAKSTCTQLSDKDINAIVRMTEGYSGSDLSALTTDAAMGPIRELGSDLRSVAAQHVRGINRRDFEAALRNVRPSVSQESLSMYQEFNESFGAGTL